MIKKLASLSCTLSALLALAVWLIIGCILSSRFGTPDIFSDINATVLLQWALMNGSSSPGILFWFACGFAAAALLFANLIACVCVRLLPQCKRRVDMQHYMLLTLHILFVFVLLGHLADVTIGFKNTDIALAEGESYTSPQGYTLHIDRILIGDNPEDFRFNRRDVRGRMSRDEFHPDRNQVFFHISGPTLPQMQGQIQMLSPFVAPDGLRITLTKFLVAEEPGDSMQADIVLSWNPFHSAAFSVTALMILCFFPLAFRLFCRGLSKEHTS